MSVSNSNLIALMPSLAVLNRDDDQRGMDGQINNSLPCENIGYCCASETLITLSYARIKILQFNSRYGFEIKLVDLPLKNVAKNLKPPRNSLVKEI